MTRKVKPLIQLEQLEPRIMLSGDSLLNIAPNPHQDTVLDNTSLADQFVEFADTNEEVEEQISQELVPSDKPNTDVCQPIFTLYLDDNTNEESVDADLSVGKIGSAHIGNVLAVLLNDSDGDIESKVGTTEDGSMPTYINDSDLSIEYATSIEIRGPPVSETVAISGMHLVDPTIDYFNGQVVYLDFDGEENIAYDGPVTIEGIDIPGFAVPGHLSIQEEAFVDQILEGLSQTFAGSGVIFTVEKPEPHTLYSTIYIGGDDSAFSKYGSFLGLAEQVDVGNKDFSDKAFVFSDRILMGQSSAGCAAVRLEDIIAHEAGHLLGYAHDSCGPGEGVLFSVAEENPSIPEEPELALSEFQVPGRLEATGTHFELEDSEYLNITLDSSEPVHLMLESVPEMVTLHIEPASGVTSTDITLGGFLPSTTYYKYEDNYHNLVTFTTDNVGKYTYTQDMSESHLVFIQPRTSTIFLTEGGWSDPTVGTWDSVTRTAVLTTDINETIQIDADNVTLDGSGHIITGSNTGSGVYIYFTGTGVTIRNLEIQGFSYGINLQSGGNNTLTGNTVSDSSWGIALRYSNSNTITGNTVSNNSNGIALAIANSNVLTGNTTNNNRDTGISLYRSKYNVLTDNTTNNNRWAGISLYIWCNFNTLTGNTANNNSDFGIRLRDSRRNTLRDNLMYDNRYNFGEEGSTAGDFYNDIDTTNLVDGKPIYHLVGVSYIEIGPSSNAGTVYCIDCDNITITGLDLTKNGYGICFYRTNNSLIENNQFNSNYRGIYLSRSNANKIYLNNFIDNPSHAYVFGENDNVFNLDKPMGGNYWSGWNAPDTDGDGFVDNPYVFFGGQDNLPWANQDGWLGVAPTTLSEKSSSESTLTETLLSQDVGLIDVAVSGDFESTLNFSSLEMVSISTGSFTGKGFSKGQFETTLVGVPYKGSWQGVMFLKAEERKIYLKGSVTGEILGTVEGCLTESIPESGIYDQYEATWKIGQLGYRVTSATIRLNGNLTYEDFSEYASTELYALQTNVEGEISGRYSGSLNTVLTHLRVLSEDSPYFGEGFSIISYVSSFGSGEGWTYDEVVSPGEVRLNGVFSSPLFGTVSGTLDESESPRRLFLRIDRVDLGLPPVPYLKVITWGQRRVSPGETVDYIVAYRNDGLKAAEDIDVVMKLPYEVQFTSATAGGTYNKASHEVVWYLGNVLPKSVGRLSTNLRVLWGLPLGTVLENVVSTPKVRIEVPVDPSIGVNYQIIDVNESQLSASVALSKPNEPESLILVEMNRHEVLEWAAPTFEYSETEEAIEFKTKLTVEGSLEEQIVTLKSSKTAIDVVAAAEDVHKYTEAALKYQDYVNWLLLEKDSIGIESHKALSDLTLCIGCVRSLITGLDLVVGDELPGWGYGLQKFIDWSLPGVDVYVGAAIYKHTVGTLPDAWNKNRDFCRQLRTLHEDEHKAFSDKKSHDTDSYESEVNVARDPNIKYGPSGRAFAGQKMDYKVEYENEGEGIAFGVYFTDTLDEDLDDSTLLIGPVISTIDGSVIAEPGIYNIGTRTITWFVGEVGPGEGGITEFSVNVRDDAENGTEIINYATVYFPSVPEETRTNGIVSIVSLNQPPVAAAGGPYTVAEGGSVLLDASGTTDPDLPDDVLTYEWDFDGDGEYDDATGVHPTFSAALLDGPDSKTVGLKVTDSYGEFNTSEAPIDVINVAPSLADAAFEIEENSPNGMVLGMISGTDPGDDLLTYSIVGGTGSTAFTIDANSGQITVADATQLDYETTPSFTLEVQVEDDDNATDAATVTINLLNQASITGTVLVDVNRNGLYEANEPGIDGITIELLDENGVPVLDTQNNPVTAITSDGGFYLFEDLNPGTYQLCEVQPTGVDDGVEILGSLGGMIPANDMMRLTLERIDATDYIFAELGQSVASGDTATIGFWQNKHGQALIRQGGATLADWLTNNFGNVFGDTFIGGDGDDVASFYRDQLFRQKSQKSAGPAKADAQFMAVALATYFTSSNLAGNVASAYGFNVTDTGIGTKLVNIGDNGTAFSVSNGTDLTIMQLLLATDNLTDQPDSLSGSARIYDLNGDGEIEEYEAVLRRLANDVFSSINEQGDIF